MDQPQRDSPAAGVSRRTRDATAKQAKQESPGSGATARPEYPIHDAQAAIRWLQAPPNRNFDQWKDSTAKRAAPWIGLRTELLNVTRLDTVKFGRYIATTCDAELGKGVQIEKNTNFTQRNRTRVAAEACKLIMQDTNVPWELTWKNG
ncbi:uncharacterized protein PAC_17963 [Phialocephala subalpina]|uniref:Uncharacterized protein n=1 Tax=Phialocephala subalpina TaxID=576137 RepID=A0A1L7XSP2_9HELO|nr:uncharacterized protein PAC_17963 [Phialocephala subalpina]